MGIRGGCVGMAGDPVGIALVLLLWALVVVVAQVFWSGHEETVVVEVGILLFRIPSSINICADPQYLRLQEGALGRVLGPAYSSSLFHILATSFLYCLGIPPPAEIRFRSSLRSVDKSYSCMWNEPPILFCKLMSLSEPLRMACSLPTALSVKLGASAAV